MASCLKYVIVAGILVGATNIGAADDTWWTWLVGKTVGHRSKLDQDIYNFERNCVSPKRDGNATWKTTMTLRRQDGQMVQYNVSLWFGSPDNRDTIFLLTGEGKDSSGETHCFNLKIPLAARTPTGRYTMRKYLDDYVRPTIWLNGRISTSYQKGGCTIPDAMPMAAKLALAQQALEQLEVDEGARQHFKENYYSELQALSVSPWSKEVNIRDAEDNIRNANELSIVGPKLALQSLMVAERDGVIKAYDQSSDSCSREQLEEFKKKMSKLGVRIPTKP